MSLKARSGRVEGEEGSSSSSSFVIVKAFHPFPCRLTDEAAFDVYSPYGLKSAGYASLALSIFSIFRLTPMLYIMLLLNLRIKLKDDFKTYQITSIIVAAVWLAFILIILILLGFMILFTPSLKKRFLLLLHPWGLLLLYFDSTIWLYLVISLQTKTCSGFNCDDSYFDHVYNLVVYFLFMYLDIFLFHVSYWIFATYFIVAELSVIESNF